MYPPQSDTPRTIPFRQLMVTLILGGSLFVGLEAGIRSLTPPHRDLRHSEWNTRIQEVAKAAGCSLGSATWLGPFAITEDSPDADTRHLMALPSSLTPACRAAIEKAVPRDLTMTYWPEPALTALTKLYGMHETDLPVLADFVPPAEVACDALALDARLHLAPSDAETLFQVTLPSEAPSDCSPSVAQFLGTHVQTRGGQPAIQVYRLTAEPAATDTQQSD